MSVDQPAKALIRAVARVLGLAVGKAGDANVSDEQQEQDARTRIPDGAEVLVIADSGGHHSGGTTDRPGYQRLLGLVASRSVAGIVAYDKSRFNRDTAANSTLLSLCIEQGSRSPRSQTGR